VPRARNSTTEEEAASAPPCANADAHGYAALGEPHADDRVGPEPPRLLLEAAERERTSTSALVGAGISREPGTSVKPTR
jgi:hypothetical protein